MASGGEVGAVIIPKPGLGNAAGNIHNAMADRSSLLVMTARESGETSERRGNIELVDWQEVMDPFMKWSYRMYDAERVPEFTRRAIQIAHTAPGGPTFLQLNEDLYKQEATGKDFTPGQIRSGLRHQSPPRSDNGTRQAACRSGKSVDHGGP